MISHLKRGALAGLIAGAVFGLVLQLASFRTPAGNRVLMMQVIGEMQGFRGLFFGWAYHLFDCTIMGTVYGVLFGARTFSYKEALKYGALFGVACWILGGLFLMPIFFGMSLFSPNTLEPIAPVAVQSLIGHFLFGGLLGATFVGLGNRMKRVKPSETPQERHEEEREPRSKAS